jgi:hypothetical protein
MSPGPRQSDCFNPAQSCWKLSDTDALSFEKNESDLPSSWVWGVKGTGGGSPMLEISWDFEETHQGEQSRASSRNKLQC